MNRIATPAATRASRRSIAAAVLLLGASLSAAAQQQPVPAAAPAAVSAKAAAITKVEIKGSADYDPRREDTASKTVITQEEILKYGDTNVYDVLKRAPGVTVIGNSIRMRGLGNGYTQILVNGERPPPGFSMESVAPEQIERIEVVRAASAEFSMQAIAGTINVVLKKVVAKAQRDLRVNLAHSAETDNVFLLGILADRSGNLSYYLNAVAARNLGTYRNRGSEQLTAPNGTLLQYRDSEGVSDNSSTMVGVQPRLSWKLGNDDQLNWSAFVQVVRNDNDWRGDYSHLTGSFSTPEYMHRHSVNLNRNRFVGADINWIAKLAGGKLDAKASVSKGSVDSDNRVLASTADRLAGSQRDSDLTSHHTTFSSTGKYTRSMFDGHALAAGWDANFQRTEEERLRVEGMVGVEPLRIADSFEPTVRRLAAFAQDEWNVTRQWSIYQGIRYETIRTDSSGTGLAATHSNSHVLSPVAQTLYKFPDKSGRQLRLALTRTYKAPTIAQLTARRYEAELNTRFSPDSSGNPDLKPELATGIDLTYEHFWAPGAVFSIGSSARRITDYIRTRLEPGGDGRWLSHPVNDGNASVHTLDVELKFPLQTVWTEAPAIDLRTSVNRNWSKVDSVPGPNNRLDQQVPLSANLGLDYKGDKVTTGLNFAFRSGGEVRVSEQQTTWLQTRRDLEAYLLYKLGKGMQLRAGASNLLGQDNLEVSRYVDATGTSQTWSRSANSRRFQANLEMKF